jgi:hypothetical protein
VKLLRLPGEADKQQSSANAIVARIVVTEKKFADPKEEDLNTEPDPSKSTMYLVNLMSVLGYYGEKFLQDQTDVTDNVHSPLNSSFENEEESAHALVRILLRLDDMPHILAWTKKNPEEGGPINIDLVELPRLHLSFEKVTLPDGKIRFICPEQSGLYLVGYKEEMKFAYLLEGIHRVVLLSNIDDEYFALIPSLAKPQIVREADSSVNVIYDMTNAEWIRNNGDASYFLYPIHSSGRNHKLNQLHSSFSQST